MNFGLGASQSDCIRYVIENVISDECLKFYTWGGTKEKESFKDLKNIINFLFSMAHAKFKELDRTMYDKKLKTWLGHTYERLKRAQ